MAILAIPATAAAKTYNVTQTNDPNPGKCNNKCSLREAVIAAEKRPGPDTIKLAAKRYELTIEGDGEEDSETGSLDIDTPVKVVGAGKRTVLAPGWETDDDYLFKVAPESGGKLTLTGVTIRDATQEVIESDEDGTLRLANVRFLGNLPSNELVTNSGKATLSRVLFRGNHASGCCPTFYNRGDGVTRMKNVTFDRNTAVNDTGAVYSDGARMIMENVTFSRNTAGSVGGALITSNGLNRLTNVTFSGNESDDSGGGLYTESGPVDLNNVTFVDNVADADDDGGGDGGGFYRAGSGETEARNTIFALNQDLGGEAPNCAGIDATDDIFSLGNNLLGFQGGCDKTNKPSDVVLNGPAGIGPLRGNGGFTQTHALKKNSPAVDAGSKKKPGTKGACAKRDQRGVKRPQGNRCDIGAFERDE